MIRLLIVDDHVIMRDGLKRVFNDEEDMVVVGEAANGLECINFLRNSMCDVVLLDVAMPKRDGMSTMQQIRHEWPSLPVLVLSMYPEDQYAIRMLKIGASGYLTKEADYEELVSAVRKVAYGKKYISASVGDLLAETLDQDQPEVPHASLSNRELQILLMIAGGKPITLIANELALSAKTVGTYRARILKKMRMKSTAELIHYAIKYALIQ